ncbi:hypothetical protein PP304_gp040 [Gordonia phage Phendrix]|uniref:Uncharacterized protein n=1 Tax=Gordonia phage Phendrix TaxID=2593335 RepID=A0A514U0X8_9CAUD|nr:hypothetical protein PP304_gp040 [Gordonia phage Phendrix]QDK02588.1 hypothetical protein SEA_PHENDRIX_40 [Gordonia phage Phendrix]
MIDTYDQRYDVAARHVLMSVLRGNAHLVMRPQIGLDHIEESRWKIISFKVKWLNVGPERTQVDVENSTLICYCESAKDQTQDTRVSAISLASFMHLFDSTGGATITQLVECSCEGHGELVPRFDGAFDRVVSKYEYVKHLASVVS